MNINDIKKYCNFSPLLTICCSGDFIEIREFLLTNKSFTNDELFLALGLTCIIRSREQLEIFEFISLMCMNYSATESTWDIITPLILSDNQLFYIFYGHISKISKFSSLEYFGQTLSREIAEIKFINYIITLHHKTRIERVNTQPSSPSNIDIKNIDIKNWGC